MSLHMPFMALAPVLRVASFCAALLVSGPASANPVPPPVGFSGSSTALGTHVSGQTSGGFLDPVVGYELARSVGFQVFGLPDSAVTRWHYAFSGHIVRMADNAALQLQASFAWDLIDAIGALHYTNWGVSWVDGPPMFGDFAGNLTAAPSTHAAGYPLPTTWSPGTFSGGGAIGFVTDIPLSTGMQGYFRHAVGMGLSGTIQSSLAVSLVAITVDLPNRTAFSDHAPYLLLDDGSRFAITTSVPEPNSGWLVLGGALALGVMRGRSGARRLNRFAPTPAANAA